MYYSLIVVIIIASISVNYANYLAIKNHKESSAIKSSIVSLKYNYYYILISAICFNYYYGYGIFYLDYNALILMMISINIIVSTIIEKKLKKIDFNIKEFFALFIIVFGVFMVVYK